MNHAHSAIGMVANDDPMDRLIDLQLQRHAWLSDAAAKVRRWREEDAAKGEPWEIDQ